jgi:hypothetical protein
MSIFSSAYSWISPVAWLQYFKGPACPAGDFVCELTDHKMHLPSFLSSVIAQFEETTGVSKYVAGPAITAGAAYLTGRYLMNKYKAKDGYDLIQKIIDAEFGPGSVADHLFKAFEKAIEDAIDAILNRAKQDKDAKPMSIKEQAAKRAQIKAGLINALAPQIKEQLVKHKDAVKGFAAQLPAKNAKVPTAPQLLEQQAKQGVEQIAAAIVRSAVEQQATASTKQVNADVKPASSLLDWVRPSAYKWDNSYLNPLTYSYFKKTNAKTPVTTPTTPSTQGATATTEAPKDAPKKDAPKSNDVASSGVLGTDGKPLQKLVM